MNDPRNNRRACIKVVNDLIRVAKAVKSLEAIHEAVKALASHADISYSAAANLLRRKSGLDTPTEDERRRLESRAIYKALYTTPVKSKPIGEPNDKVEEYKMLRISIIDINEAEF